MQVLSKLAGAIQMPAAGMEGPRSNGFALRLQGQVPAVSPPSYVTLEKGPHALSLACHICKMGMPAS